MQLFTKFVTHDLFATQCLLLLLTLSWKYSSDSLVFMRYPTNIYYNYKKLNDSLSGTLGGYGVVNIYCLVNIAKVLRVMYLMVNWGWNRICQGLRGLIGQN